MEMTKMQKRVAKWFGMVPILEELESYDKEKNKKIIAMDEDNKNLKETVARLQDKVARLQDQVQERISELDTSAQMMEQMKQQSDKKIASLEANLYTLRSLDDDRNNEYKELLSKYQKLNNSYVEKEELSIRQDEIIKNMQEDLRGNADIIEILKKNVNELKANNDEAEDLIKTQNETINELQDEMRKYKSYNQCLSDNVKKLREDFFVSKQTIRSLHGRIGGLTAKLNRMMRDAQVKSEK